MQTVVDDKLIWEAIGQGKKQALKQLHEKYYRQMYLYAIHATKNPGVSEELVSDCFITLWEKRKAIQIHSTLKPYLFLMLRNAIIDHYRKKRPLTEMLTEIAEPASEQFFDAQKQYATLYSAIEKLPAQCRRILELAAFDSFTYDQIAEQLHISRNTVKTQMGRAYRFLREKLNPNDFLFLCFFRKKT